MLTFFSGTQGPADDAKRFDTTLIVSLAIPMSIITTAVVLYFMDKSLNVLSMMGLMLGVGLLVNYAIVVLESIQGGFGGGRRRDRAMVLRP